MFANRIRRYHEYHKYIKSLIGGDFTDTRKLSINQGAYGSFNFIEIIIKLQIYS